MDETVTDAPTPAASAADPAVVRVSIVAPMKNEAANVKSLADEIAAHCGPLAPFEAIFVDDGSDDETANAIDRAQLEHPWLRRVSHAQSCGQSAAVRTGVEQARAPIVLTLDGDGQNPPSELPKIARPLLEDAEGRLGLVAGQRVARQDTWSKRAASRFANGLRARILKDDTRDTGCGLKAFRRDAFLALPFFDHLHRYLPALFKREGWGIAHVDVAHRAREHGRSKYTNLGRAIVGVTDLAGVWWLLRRRKLPRIASSSEAPNGAARKDS
ncbi:MAG: glycosyltransferase family 2 protein [Pseudomonadota bacterium]